MAAHVEVADATKNGEIKMFRSASIRQLGTRSSVAFGLSSALRKIRKTSRNIWQSRMAYRVAVFFTFFFATLF